MEKKKLGFEAERHEELAPKIREDIEEYRELACEISRRYRKDSSVSRRAMGVVRTLTDLRHELDDCFLVENTLVGCMDSPYFRIRKENRSKCSVDENETCLTESV